MSLELQAVTLTRGGRDLIHQVDLSLECGQVTSVIGANGAGKSTVLKLLCGEQRATSGSVLCEGARLDTYSLADLARMRAVLPQQAGLDFPFLVREVIEMGRIPHFTGARIDHQLVEAVIERLGLGPLASRVYTTLSGGERQRVHIARVLAQVWDTLEGSYLMFDEPTAPLDLAHQLTFLELVHELARGGAGVLLVMHDINLAARFSDHIVLLQAGRLLGAGAPDDVITVNLVRQAFGVEVDVAPGPLVYARRAVLADDDVR